MINDVKKFMEVAQILPKRGEFDTRQTALYVGLVLEEVVELLTTIGVANILSDDLDDLSNKFKSGNFDNAINETSKDERVEMLDALLDTAWVSIGGAYSMGCDVEQATGILSNNNLSKFPECPVCSGYGEIGVSEIDVEECVDCNGTGRNVIRDVNGKIMKPYGYVKVDFSECM